MQEKPSSPDSTVPQTVESESVDAEPIENATGSGEVGSAEVHGEAAVSDSDPDLATGDPSEGDSPNDLANGGDSSTAGEGSGGVEIATERVVDPDDPAEIARKNAELLEKHRRKHKGLLPESWSIKLPAFEGPLDLLLHLIRVDEVEIADIPVALICDQYHAYLELMEELDLDIAGDYIYEAALLIQLKARMLLPAPKVEEGEEQPEDPREELVRRLLEYRRLKDAAQTLAEVDSVRRGVWTRQPEEIAPDPGDNEIDLGDLSLFDLLSVFRKVLNRYDNENPPPLIFRGESYSVRGQVDRLLKRLDTSKPLDLVDDLLALSCRSEAIASFLAILELTKMELMRLHLTGDGGVLMYRTTRQVTLQELETISQ